VSKLVCTYTDTITEDEDSTYPGVSLGSLRGKLRLSRGQLCFEPKDGARKIKIGWDQIEKHMVSSSSSPNTFLKIVSKKNTAKIIKFPSRESLIQIQQEITRRKSSFHDNHDEATPSKRTSAPTSFQSDKTNGNSSHGKSRVGKLRKTQSLAVRGPKPDYDWEQHRMGDSSWHVSSDRLDAEQANADEGKNEATDSSTNVQNERKTDNLRSSLTLDFMGKEEEDDEHEEEDQFNIQDAPRSSARSPASNPYLNSSLGGSLSFENSFSMNDTEIESQILKAFGGLAGAGGNSSKDMDAKAARKSRMSVRMSTRVAAMNDSSRSRLDAGGGNRRVSTRMSVRNTRMSTRMSVTRRGSGSFVMLKDLEERDEFQKVQAGAFLRELHKMADAANKQNLRETILTRTVSKSAGSISFEGMDLSSLTPEQAKTTINALHEGGKIEGDSLISLIQAGVAVLSEEETVIDLRDLHPTLNKVTAVGDLHGSLECLKVVIQFADIHNLGDGSVVVFDGDFVDRGNNSLEVIATLLLLKLSRPQNVILLRGNHEDSMTASSYGFREEVDEKYGYEKGDEIWWEFGMLFAAFPICARSNTAAIMHGGIPVEEFDLDDLNELEKETRCQMKTISDPYDDDERLLQGILWSDPSEEAGINFSDRGAGFTFGPDISADFLERHELRYLIRAHEVVETGYCKHDVGDDRGVITIFSSANYPAMEGTNHGAVLFLDDQTGEYETKDFIHKEDNESQESNLLQAVLGAFVDGHKTHLTKSFREAQDDNGHITCEQWADTIAELLDLPDASLTWLDMQPEIAPTTEPDGDSIDWAAFINRYTTAPTALVEGLDTLSENKDKILDIFQLIDTSMDGAISKEEFSAGIELLNQQIADDDLKIHNPEKLFDAFDADHDGELTIEEFSKALQESTHESTALKGLTDALKDDQVAHLKHKQDVISTVFKYLDADKNGGIDRLEFQKGFEALNEQMGERNKFGNHEEWFDMFELNDAEQIGKFRLHDLLVPRQRVFL